MNNLILPNKNILYNALLNKDSNYEGIFFAGIKTTGIFCRPSCTARKPKKENVEYFPSVNEALQHGYRPCKVCHPLKPKGEVPSWLKLLLKEIDQNQNIKLKDADLRKREIDPARIRRWFKKNHGMTFQAYLRMLRINSAFGRIKHGEKVIESAFNGGYESLSGFTESFKKSTGFSPSQSKHKNVISITRILTPLGPMLAGATDEGICLLEFVDRRMLETQIKRLKKYLHAELVPGNNKYFDELSYQLKEYFDGERKVFDVTLDDFASNDYLGLSRNKKQFKKAVKLVEEFTVVSSKASMLVNGYHPIHRIFEKEMAEVNGFDEGIVVGSGFLANLSLIEALVRKGDMLFMDEEYHASGVMASKLLGDRVVTFAHNDVDDLRAKLEANPAHRQIIAVEGIYSMSGDLCKKEIFALADEFDTLLIVDEAHSAGVLGKNLLGIFEHYKIPIRPRHIKMGTLGKAYGSYGAYILASKNIISFLENRAKPIIYSTAPSVFDTALALVNLEHIQKNANMNIYF